MHRGEHTATLGTQTGTGIVVGHGAACYWVHRQGIACPQPVHSPPTAHRPWSLPATINERCLLAVMGSGGYWAKGSGLPELGAAEHTPGTLLPALALFLFLFFLEAYNEQRAFLQMWGFFSHCTFGLAAHLSWFLPSLAPFIHNLRISVIALALAASGSHFWKCFVSLVSSSLI